MKALWKRYRPLRILSPIALVLIWEGIVRLGGVNQLLVPAPGSVLRTMVDLTMNGQLPWAIAVSLVRVLQGFIYGSLVGIALGLLVGWFRAIQAGLYHVVGSGDNLLHPIYVSDVVDGMLRCGAPPPEERGLLRLICPPCGLEIVLERRSICRCGPPKEPELRFTSRLGPVTVEELRSY